MGNDSIFFCLSDTIGDIHCRIDCICGEQRKGKCSDVIDKPHIIT